MRTYALKPKVPQRYTPSPSTKPGRAASGPHREAGPLLPAPATDAAGDAPAGLVRDFSRIPVFSEAHRLIQPKLKVNAPGDAHEQEADRTAARVMNTPGQQAANAPPKPLAASITPLLQREMGPEEEEEELLQTKPSRAGTGGAAGATHWLESRLSSSQGGGSPLPEPVRTFMEPRFGADFGDVRVHTDADAVRMNHSLNAQAFTHRNNIYFGAGKSAGRDALTAHELTHVLQQTGGRPGAAHAPGVQREVQVRPPGRGEASAFDRREELIDRMNGLSTGLEYWLDDRVLRYNVLDEAALTPFDRRMRGFIDRAEVVPMRLITGAGYVDGGPLLMDSLQLGYVDLDDLMASDDLGFQSVMIHFLTERFNVRNYDRRLGMASVGAEWGRVHPMGVRAEAEFLQDLFDDPSIHHNWVDENASRLISAFRSRDERYHIFIIIRGGGRERRGAEISVRTRDGRRMSAEDFLAERAAVAP